MEILEHGNPETLKRTKVFKCGNCGCKFKADEDEYKYAGRYEDYYYCQCPECLNKACESADKS